MAEDKQLGSFKAPGSGRWTIFPRGSPPCSRVMQPLMERAWGAGMREFNKDYGLIFYSRARFVSGYLYTKYFVDEDFGKWQGLVLAPLLLGTGAKWKRQYLTRVAWSVDQINRAT